MVAEDFLQEPVRQRLDGVGPTWTLLTPRFAGRTVAMKRSAASRANASTGMTRTADRLMTLISARLRSLALPNRPTSVMPAARYSASSTFRSAYFIRTICDFE